MLWSFVPWLRFFKIGRSRGGHDFHITVLKWKEELGLFGVSLDQTWPIAGLGTRDGAANLKLGFRSETSWTHQQMKIQKQRQKIQTQTLAITILETQEAHQQIQLQGSIFKERGLKIACREVCEGSQRQHIKDLIWEELVGMTKIIGSFDQQQHGHNIWPRIIFLQV